ncbi:MAG: TetR/AcrR family transcriptional regulator [Gemmatimonadaceae bacterium]|jgi:AcrR family transcriptional regulator|nr:TetR/AcrR family transcriptional regulator [Gemmatimonadaceae bacterium]
MTDESTPPARRSTRGRRAGVPDGDTEQRILDAARRVFVRRGTGGARLQEVADEAGVTQALVLYYFTSKDALAERVFLDVARTMMNALIGRPTSFDASLESLIEQLVTAYIDAVRHAPFIPGYLLAEAQQQPERVERLVGQAIGTMPSQMAAMMLAHVTREIERRVADGTMRPMTPRQLLVNVMALTIFPFVAQPILRTVMGFDEQRFSDFLDERRRELPAFIINALRP